MESKTKKITRIGNSVGVVIDTYILFGSGLKLGDKVSMKCQKNKIIITKIQGE